MNEPPAIGEIDTNSLQEVSASEITVQDLTERLSRGTVDLVDVRTPLEFQEVHASQAYNVPLDRLDPHKLMKGRGAEPLYVICKSGSRGATAQRKLINAG